MRSAAAAAVDHAPAAVVESILGQGSGDNRKAEVRRLAVHCSAYRGAVPWRSWTQVANTVLPFLGLMTTMLLLAESHLWATLLLSIPAAGFLLRIFVIQHDCGHGSFMRSRLANDWLGRALSVLTLTPYDVWRRTHARHHATSGNLTKRGYGDITTLTVREYRSRSLLQRLKYRIYRNPVFLFGFGAPMFFVVLQRLPFGQPLEFREIWRDTLILNALIIVFYGALVMAFGWWAVLMATSPVVFIASAAGGWLFFIQHQFEDTHWEQDESWDFQVAAVDGSSYYALPAILRWFTGSIGLHHIHHLNSMIPNYRLQPCLEACPELATVNRMTLLESFACVRLALWDERQRRLVSFREAVAPA